MRKKDNVGFFKLVYDVVAVIPKGRVATYGQIARLLGGFCSGRTVGFAMRAAPAERNLPCHRVVNRLGEMAPGYCFGGAEAQRRLLRKEGVRFLPDGRIDMKKSQMSLPDAPDCSSPSPAAEKNQCPPAKRQAPRRKKPGCLPAKKL